MDPSHNVADPKSSLARKSKWRGHPVNLKIGQKNGFFGKYLGDSYSLRIENLVSKLLELQSRPTGYRFTDDAVFSVRCRFSSGYSEQESKPWRIWLQPSALTKLLLAMSTSCPPSNLSPSYAEFVELLLNLAECPSLEYALQSGLLESYAVTDKYPVAVAPVAPRPRNSRKRSGSPDQDSVNSDDGCLSAGSSTGSSAGSSDGSSGGHPDSPAAKRRITIQSLMNSDPLDLDCCAY
ncbi:uncharacterized protein BJ171DRAFT_584260 [Polychytrium aggregatum]|uniref:uncharacterized protein n=1 Tax=Polychytrium aggregatum TaxID=110093 RepID=UPI0022FE425C|nr:uncharacterized protein BJ171DRAFT_584260 [Polychytrium aggregatum]KAI9202352.1 hypothetical protein BJ171DRAFT_584260 [Polychytrium aggregatum]